MTDGEEGLEAAHREPKGGGEPRTTDRLDELRYFPESANRGSSIAIGFVLVPGLAAYALVTVVSGSKLLGFLVGLAVTLWPIIKQRRAKAIPRATLRIEGDQLHLSGPAFGHALSVTLDDLLDVYLDTKTIQRLREAPNPVPMTRFLNQTVGGEQDVARIGLELANETLFLTEDRVSHLDANEWFSKIRRFLRQHGWVPEDERAELG
jgi:hypothetical protein